MRNALSIGLAAILLLCCAGIGQAVTMTLVNENFDGMGTGTALPSGWTDGYLGTVGTQNRLVMSPYAGNGQAITAMPVYAMAAIGADFTTNGGAPGVTDVGHVFNLGAAATNPATDRALGNYPRTNPSGDHVIQVAFSNNTGYPIDSITLDYDMEQWGRGQGKSSSGLELLRVLFSSTSATSGFTYLGSAFDGVAPIQLITPTPTTFPFIDGNDPANKAHVSGTYLLSAPLDPGASMWLRFHDWNENSTTDHVLAIDNVTVTADVVPEPSTLALLAAGALAALGLVLRRRK